MFISVLPRKIVFVRSLTLRALRQLPLGAEGLQQPGAKAVLALLG
jgi:hypothetical protein